MLCVVDYRCSYDIAEGRTVWSYSNHLEQRAKMTVNVDIGGWARIIISS